MPAVIAHETHVGTSLHTSGRWWDRMVETQIVNRTTPDVQPKLVPRPSQVRVLRRGDQPAKFFRVVADKGRPKVQRRRRVVRLDGKAVNPSQILPEEVAPRIAPRQKVVQEKTQER